MELISEVIEKWIKLQQGYMYLYPILTSNDIKKTLAQLVKMFKQVDIHWKNIILQCGKESIV